MTQHRSEIGTASLDTSDSSQHFIDLPNSWSVLEDLRVSEERFRVALKNSPVVVFHQDLDLRYTWINNPVFAWAEKVWLGKTDMDILEPESAQRLTALKRQVLETGVGTREEVEVAYEGRFVYYDLTVEPLRDRLGKLVGITCTGTDVTQRKLMEKQVLHTQKLVAQREGEQRFNQFFETLPECCYMISPTGHILDINPAACHGFGYTREELIGKHLSFIYAPESIPNKLELLEKRKDSGKLQHEEMVILTKQGQRRTVLLNSGSVRDANGNLLYSTSVQVDITDRKNLLLEQIRMREELADLNQVASMSQLAASLAHELAQPMTSMLATAQAAERLASYPDPDLSMIRVALASIAEENRRAKAIMQNMRAMFRKRPITLQELDLNKIVDDVIDMEKREVQLREVTIRMTLAAGGVLVLGDETVLRQVLLNLFSNAMEAMREIPIECRLLTVTTSLNAPAIRGTLLVEDSGSGIAEKDKPRLFTPFFTTKSEGLGVGLTICRSLLESLGGRISVEDKSKPGAAFRVELPLALQKNSPLSS